MALNLVFTVTDERTWGPGTILAGKYRVERVLGTGGMGVVVAAIHEQLEERVAVKLLRSERCAQKEACERVLREARATVKIQSDHVVRVFDVGTLEDGAPYIVMEYLQGCDLAQLLTAEGTFAIADAASYVRQACDAIGKAHSLGIVHRDLKPANLFLAVRDEVACLKVLDFGISKLLTADGFDPGLTGAAALLGSPTYMSPEQIESPRDVDRRTDVWSLGVILYELVTGAHPFVGDTFAQLAKQITSAPTPALRALRPDAPEALEAIVNKCLAKARDDRYPDVGALAEALAPIAREADKKALPAFARTAMAKDGVDTRPVVSQAGAQQALTPIGIETRSRGKLALACGLAAAAIAGVVAFGVTRGDAPDAEPAAASFSGPEAVLACPQLIGRVENAPAGWLGAATATIVCTRAQAQMGGRAARTRLPAELLGLPRVPIDKFPIDPFESPTSRQRQLDAIGSAVAFVDGEVVRGSHAFEVRLVLRATADKRELAQGSAKGTHLIETIREAMQPLEAQIPRAPDGDPFLLAWTGARTSAAAVAMADYNLVRNTGDTHAECDRILARTDVDDTTHRILQGYCKPPPPTAPWQPVPLDTSSPAALRKSLELDPHFERRSLADDLPLIDAALATLTDHEERSFLLAQKSALLTVHGKGDQATDVVLLALQESPKALDVFDAPWSILSFLHSATTSPAAANAWVPWSVEAYCMTATQSTDPAIKIESGRRNHILSREDLWTANLAEFLIDGGRRDEATAVAAQGTFVATKLLLAAADAKFAKAIQLADELLPTVKEPLDATQMGTYLADIGLLSGLPTPALDAMVQRYLTDDQGVGVNDLVITYNLLHACLGASREIARRCYAKLPKMWVGPIAWQEGLLEGAQKFVEGDYEGASRAWRPMLVHPSWQLDFMRDFVATAFERAGYDDLVERIDQPLLSNPGRYNGGSLAYARAARRELRRNHPKEAKAWATKLIDAWGVADTKVLVVDEMRKLVARP